MTRPKCIRCGKTLPKVYADEKKIKLLGYGYAANGAFCTLTCGFWFAVHIIDEASKQHVG